MTECNAQEYYTATRVPYAQVTRMPGKRYYSEVVRLCGKEIGRKDQSITRGKVVSETYMIAGVVS